MREFQPKSNKELTANAVNRSRKRENKQVLWRPIYSGSQKKLIPFWVK